MALTKIGLGTTPNDGTGDDLRTGGQLVNDSFDQIDTNVTDIATNASDIATNTAEIANRVLLQSKSFVSPSTTLIQNNSDTVFVDTDLIVAITPKSATSKLRVNFVAQFGTGNTTQTGVKGNIQKKIGASAWANILFGNQTLNFAVKDPDTSGATDRWHVNSSTIIDSPGISDEVQFKVTFAAQLNGVNVDYLDTSGIRMITVDEIEE